MAWCSYWEFTAEVTSNERALVHKKKKVDQKGENVGNMKAKT